jgi:hypothetical protein
LNVLLKTYGEQKGYEVRAAEAKGIFYYGKRSIPKEFALFGNELDSHFNWQVYQEVEHVNAYFQSKLYEYCKKQERTEDIWSSPDSEAKALGMNKSKPFGIGDLEKDFADLTEDEIYKLLLSEMGGLRRATIVMRLHQRYTALRAEREKSGLLEKLKQKTIIKK